MKNNKNIGSSFESFLEEAGILEEVNAAAIKAISARNLKKHLEKCIKIIFFIILSHVATTEAYLNLDEIKLLLQVSQHATIYDILEISRTASPEEIKKAYLACTKKLENYPNKNQETRKEAKKIFNKLQKLYNATKPAKQETRHKTASCTIT